MLVCLVGPSARAEAAGVYVRFHLIAPESAKYYVKLGGYTHVANWRLPDATIPAGADRNAGARLGSGEYTEWFDLKTQAGKLLHGRHNRAGGLAEFPNVTVSFIAEPNAPEREVEIELATAPDAVAVVKRWHEKFIGTETSFLVSPDLATDAAELETATEMTARRLRWAEEATHGERHSPSQLLVQTQLWGAQRPELNEKEARVLSLLGFNVVGNVPEEQRARFPELRAPSASHDVLLGPSNTRQQIADVWDKLAAATGGRVQAGAPFNFQDEVVARPPIGQDAEARRHFRDWLGEQQIVPAELGAATLGEVIPIETPEVLRERMKSGEAAARRVFYYTSRFRQHALTERLRWNTEEMHQRLGAGVLSSTLVADHPYFGGTGLGMGMDEPNDTWGGWPLAADWFEIARRHAVDLIGVEDWMGLQFMYGPASTWEGFQLMGFQSAIFRSGSRGTLPIIAWITPSDERNLRLKTASALCEGAKHLYFWSYGPTATCTENYWSDQPGCYPGMTHLSRLLEFAEPVVAPGTMRRTRVALLYSLSSDLWQPFGYLHMLERRGLYLALIHEQFGVDFLTEEDLTAGRLADYRILYTADPCISSAAAGAITRWTAEGGTLFGTCAAGTRNEFGEPTAALGEVFGVDAASAPEVQPGRYRIRAALNDLAAWARVEPEGLEWVGLRQKVEAKGAEVKSRFADSHLPALTEHPYGKGRACFAAGTPGISYLKAAHFQPAELAEKWQPAYRQTLIAAAHQAGVQPLVKLSSPVVEAGLYDTPTGTSLVLANFTYHPIDSLQIEVPTRRRAIAVKSLQQPEIAFQTAEASPALQAEGYLFVARFAAPLGLDEVYLLEMER